MPLSARKQEERQARKARIVEAALKVIHEKGLEAAKLEEIAAEAGFGRASLYYYFPSREHLFGYIFELGWNRLWTAIEEDVNRSGSPRERFMAIMKKINHLALEDRVLYTFLFTGPKVLLNLPGTEQVWKDSQSRLYAVLRGLLEEGMAEGEFPRMNAGVLMRALGGVFHGLLFLGDGKRAVDEDEIEEMISRLLEVPPLEETP